MALNKVDLCGVNTSKLPLLNNEENLTSGKYNVTFGIFSLKNNFGWTEKQDINVNANANVNNSYANLTDEELRKLANKK